MPTKPVPNKRYDMAIIGDGLSGLLMTCLAASRGLQCALIGMNKPPQNSLSVNDARTTAVMMHNIALFKEIGIWETLADFSSPLETIRIVTGNNKPKMSDFHAAEQDVSAFAYNIPNDILKHTLWQKILADDNVAVFSSQKAIDIAQKASHARITTDKNNTIDATLVVAADGRQSAIRDQLDIAIKSFDYEQKALVFSVAHKRPHENVSIERHKAHGPFTFVPLPDTHRSSVVWCDKDNRIDEIVRMPEKLFLDEMQIVSANQLSTLSKPSKPYVFSLSSFYATRLIGPRTALIGEAAHAVHPLGAQGFNLTIRDIATLDEEVMRFYKLGLDIGSDTLLSHYQSRRQSNVQGRVRMMHRLTKISSTTGQGLQSIWGTSIALASHLPALRRWVMKLGMAPNDPQTPEILKQKRAS